MASTTPDRRKSDAQSETDRRSAPRWRLRWQVGDLAHYTAWCEDFAVVNGGTSNARSSTPSPTGS